MLIGDLKKVGEPVYVYCFCFFTADNIKHTKKINYYCTESLRKEKEIIRADKGCPMHVKVHVSIRGKGPRKLRRGWGSSRTALYFPGGALTLLNVMSSFDVTRSETTPSTLSNSRLRPDSITRTSTA